ncbi:ribonuclease R [Candidatus Sumerlaeota bacterium]|nr:ribonuclease R [Candidatus Sumerlaeota bacterium]
MPTIKELRELFESNPRNLYKISDILRILDLKRPYRKEVQNMLRQLEEEGRIHRFKNRRYGLLQSADIITGTLRIAKKGFGFVRNDAQSPDKKTLPDVYINRKNLGAALPGDRVLARLTGRDTERPEGRIAKVLQHAHPEIVGQFYFEKKGGMVIPRDTRINRVIRISKPGFKNELKNGDYVLARIHDYGDSRTPMMGEIAEIFGQSDEPGLDILLIIRDHGVRPEFPEEVIKESESLPHDISEKEISLRMDFRKIKTFTIDPETAKDFDDALSIERLPNGHYKLGVHIADVAHYVPPGSGIDEEAFNRATSIYPVDRVIPMLPERLSNDLCSLKPEVDRLAMSVIMDVDSEGKVHHSEFYNSVIHSRFRMNYEEAQAVFDHSDPWICSKYASVREDLFHLRELSEILIRMRERSGALDLDVGETDIVFDSSGAVVDICRHPRLASHRLVEQCMILANEAVARKISRLHVPSMYRIHEPPSQEKLHRLVPFFGAYGVHLPPKQNITPAKLQAALEQIERLGEKGPILRRVILRAMMRAQYSPHNKGHYGLASACYAHFTSPIRRYPDLIVHRVLKDVISGEYKNAERQKEREKLLHEWAEHCTDREGLSEEIENESTNIKGLEFMRKFLGYEFEGIISGVAGFGLFVELMRYPIEGMIPIDSLGRDYFIFEESAMRLVGKRSGKTFRLGDKVNVVIERIDILKQEMDLGIA